LVCPPLLITNTDTGWIDICTHEASGCVGDDVKSGLQYCLKMDSPICFIHSAETSHFLQGINPRQPLSDTDLSQSDNHVCAKASGHKQTGTNMLMSCIHS